jgi:cytochrome c oxidase subunit 4
MSQHVVGLRLNATIYVVLLGLLALTIGAAYIDLGRWNVLVALMIAAIKATLIVLFFMHVKYSHRLTWVFSIAGLLWFAILVVLTFTDYDTRGWLDIPGK